MKKILLLLCLTVVSFVNKLSAQNNYERLNDFKFVVVPMQYAMFDEENKYLLNSLSKHLLTEAGFTTYVNTDPKLTNMELDRCMGLYAHISGTPEDFFSLKTKIRLQLKDCKGNLVYETSEGVSKLKKYKEAYQEALRDAASALSSLDYAYNGGEGYFASQKEDVATKEVIEEETALDRATSFDYSYGENLYKVEKIEAGYIIKSKETNSKLGYLHYNQNNVILYNSKNINGTATIKNGNLVVEYFDVDAGRLKELVFKRVTE